MTISQYDTVLLKDGRIACIVEVLSQIDFLADVGSSPADWDSIAISIDDIDKVFNMKLRYIGESFGVDELTNGKIYKCVEENGMYRVIDDSDEDYLYSMTNPAPLDQSSKGGKWERVNDD